MEKQQGQLSDQSPQGSRVLSWFPIPPAAAHPLSVPHSGCPICSPLQQQRWALQPTVASAPPAPRRSLLRPWHPYLPSQRCTALLEAPWVAVDPKDTLSHVRKGISAWSHGKAALWDFPCLTALSVEQTPRARRAGHATGAWRGDGQLEQPAWQAVPLPVGQTAGKLCYCN